MSFLFNIKDATYKWIGIALILFDILLIFASAPYLFVPKEQAMAIEVLGICGPMFMIPGLIFIYFGFQAEKERKGYEKLAGFLKAYRRIKVAALAKKLELSEYETERRILKCVRLGIITGYIDRASDEFYNPSGMEGKALISCPNCGAPVEQLVLAGETGKCPFCQSLLVPKAKT
jgi:hypothetical protein